MGVNDSNTIICLMGPTASGKTDLAIALTQQFPCEIISVDSAMVYKGMDIGSATPNQEELTRAPHRLINIRDPNEPYSVGEFCSDAHREIKEILSEGKIPLLVGGTMLYFNMLQRGFDNLPDTDVAAREKVNTMAKASSWPQLHQLLSEIDPGTAARIHSNDSQRISRALEIYYATNKTMTQWHQEQDLKALSYRTINLIVSPQDRTVLHKRIEQRFDKMLAEGFIDEVKKLYERDDLDATLSSIRSVGYRQAWEFLTGNCDETAMREKAIIATRQLAKRQFTWLRRWEDAKWFESLDPELNQKVLEYLSSYE